MTCPVCVGPVDEEFICQACCIAVCPEWVPLVEVEAVAKKGK